MVPTFLGSTVLVFVILQIAPGGPIEKAIMELQMGGMEDGGSGGNFSENVLPESALKELERFYGFDKPIYLRYLSWLGIAPRETRHRDFNFDKDQDLVEVRVGKRDGKLWKVDISKNGDGSLVVKEKSSENSSVWSARIDNELDDGSIEAVVFQKEFSGILTGNLGKSYIYAKPVTEIMAPRFRISLFLGLTGMLLSYLVCIPLGIKKALNHGTSFDIGSSLLIFIAYSIPGWALGGVLLVLLGGGSFLDIFPLGGLHSPREIWEQLSPMQKVFDQLHHMILPIIAWSIGSFATLTVLMKNGLLENLGQDYVRTAFAKGISEKRVIWLHAIRNSIIPIAANIGQIIGVVISGSYFIERVFNIEGFGKLAFEAILQRDYPVTLGFLVIVVMLRLLGNIISDLSLALVDPRIRFK
ncbi:MAG: ABC transporter permease subunit [Candidatus Neomarinimicrobiota bacterium]